MTEPETTPGSRWGPTTKRIVKLALLGLVVAFLARHALRVRDDFVARALPRSFRYGWLAGAGGLYLLGLVAFGVYFHRVLARSPTPVTHYAALRAYLISHLAKYVPGKAMVVVVRSGLVAEAGARPATAAFATLYETLVMMAAGGLLAAVGFLWTPPRDPRILYIPADAGPPGLDFLPQWVPLVGLGLGAGIGFLILVWPRVFPRLAGLIRRPLRGVGADALPRLSGSLLVQGLLWASLGWLFLGLSQVAVLASLPTGTGANPVRMLGLWPVVVASVALATIAGFAVPIAPGGLGVREFVLWSALGTAIDDNQAVVAALLLRVVWLATEVVAAAALYWVRPRPRASG